MNALRHRPPPAWPPRDIIAHTRTLATPGAAATAKKEFENPRYMELLIPHHYVHPLLSKLAGIRSGGRVIYWDIGRDRTRAGIRVPGSAVPISQGPTPPARR